MKKITAAQIAEVRAQVEAELNAQLKRKETHEARLIELEASFKLTGTAPTREDSKLITDEISNAGQRIDYARLVLSFDDKKLKTIMGHSSTAAFLIKPHNIYNMRHGLLDMFGIIDGSKNPEAKGLVKMACFFAPFQKALTVSFEDLDRAVKKAITNSNNRWNGAYCDALEAAGAAVIHKRGKKIEACTIDPDHFLIKGLQEKAMIGKLADH